MIIEIGDYELEQSGTKFHLWWNKEISKKVVVEDDEGIRSRVNTNETGVYKVILGYDMELEKCLRKIIGNELTEKEMKVDLSEWLKLYKQEEEKFTTLLKQIKL